MQADTAAPAAQTASALTPLQIAVYAALMNGPALESVLGGAAQWDANTGLLWELETTTHDRHAEAIETAAAKTLGGYTWRVPKRPELGTLVKLDARKPATYPAMAKSTPTDDLYYTDSDVEGYPSFVWFVFFSSGYVSYYYRNGRGRLRAVCGPVPRPGQ